MDDTEDAVVDQMIGDLAHNIEIAKRHSYDLAARLLDMARIELLTRHYGIDDQEFAQFCKGLESRLKRRSSAVPTSLTSISSGRRRKDEPKPRARLRPSARRSKTSLAE